MESKQKKEPEVVFSDNGYRPVVATTDGPYIRGKGLVARKTNTSYDEFNSIPMKKVN